MILLRDVIDLPVEVYDGDYVLRLTEGVDKAEETVGQYVVTDALAEAFDRALGLVGNGLRSGRSQAAFVHGSFGSGKSHFMAVLHLLLGGSSAARRIRELAPVIARHDPVLQGRSLLRLTFHMIGAESLEEGIFRRYVEQVAELHPGAPLPAVHRTEKLFEDAARHRATLGDEAFFATLNEAGGGASVWAPITGRGRWDAERFERARAARLDDPERANLASALTRTMFTAFTSAAEYVDIDTGLRAIAEHAKGLGYDGVVLFLDELVLWLASKLPDREFVSREGAKVSKLVESGDAHRPVPIVSFIARQRDLKDFLGEGTPGAEQEAVGQVFRYWEDRFSRITLGDENLPHIINRRLLQPRDEAARQLLDDAFARLDRRPDVWDTLLDGINTSDTHRGADQAAFRLTYPFSPALVSVMVAVAGAMGKERTGLKVMANILKDQRDHLGIDDVIGVGDLFDYIVRSGDTAVAPQMERRFRAARALYTEKLLPMLLAEHGLDEDDLKTLDHRHPFRADDRIVKTLLLAGVVPGVPALKSLTGRRIAALNHGSIRSPLRGEEGATVVSKVRRWRVEVPELEVVGDGANPTISIRLVDVDYQSVLRQVATENNPGNRRRLLRELIYESLGIRYDPTVYGVQDHEIVWRGSRRVVEVLFGNVRDPNEITDEQLAHGRDTWRVVLDYPFDDHPHSPVEDLRRVEALAAAGHESLTVAWVPRFLSQARFEDLGTLVLLEHLFQHGGEKFDASATHLSPTDRAQARAILETMRASLRERLRETLQQAYGAARPVPGDIADIGGQDRVLATLAPGFRPQDPVGADLRRAFTNLAGQMFEHTWPAHPSFTPGDRPVTVGELRKVLDYVARARQDPNGRVPAERADRDALGRVCQPLGIGELHENVYVLDDNNFPWRKWFVQRMGQADLAPDAPVTVRRLRGWVDDPDTRRGLDRLVANLVIAAWALFTDRTFHLYGARVEPGIDKIDDDMELRPQPLPAQAAWDHARQRAATLLGVTGNPYLTAANLAAFADKTRQAAATRAPGADRLVAALERHRSWLGLGGDAPSGRLATARAAARLVRDLRNADELRLVELLDGAELPAGDDVVARSLATSTAVATALDSAGWDLFQAIASLPGQAGQAAQAALDDLARAGGDDEFHTPIEPVLGSVRTRAVRLLADQRVTPPPNPVQPPIIQPPHPPRPVPPPPTSTMPRGEALLGPGAGQGDLDEVRASLADFVARHPGRRIRVRWEVDEP